MPESFQTILQRYTQNQIANTRTTAQGFSRLAERGSIGAALTFGLLSAKADQAEAQQQSLAASLQGEQLALEQRKVAAEEQRAQSLSNLQNSQAAKVDAETGLLPEDARTINALRRAQAAGAISDAEYRDVQTGILSKYGGAEIQAGIVQKLAQAGASTAAARKTAADASVVEQTGIRAANQEIAESQGRTFANVANANTNRYQAQSGRITAVSNAGFTGARTVGQQQENYLTSVYGGAEKAAGIESVTAGTAATISNAGSTRINANANQFQAVTDQMYKDGLLTQQQRDFALSKYRAVNDVEIRKQQVKQNAAISLYDKKLQLANTQFNNELLGRKYDDDKQRRRYEILGTQIGAINDLDTLKKQREELSKGIDEARNDTWYNVFGLFSDEEKEQALLDARYLLDRKIGAYEQALQ